MWHPFFILFKSKNALSLQQTNSNPFAPKIYDMLAVHACYLVIKHQIDVDTVLVGVHYQRAGNCVSIVTKGHELNIIIA